MLFPLIDREGYTRCYLSGEIASRHSIASLNGTPCSDCGAPMIVRSAKQARCPRCSAVHQAAKGAERSRQARAGARGARVTA